MNATEQNRLSRRLLALLQLPHAVGRIERDAIIVSVNQKGISLSKGSVPPLAAEILVERGQAQWRINHNKMRELILTPVTEPVLAAKVVESSAPPDRFRLQHGGVKERVVVIEKKRTNVHFNEAESPLLWLSRRKGRDGAAMISQSAFVAGERLRQDYTMANLTPRVTADWSNPTRGSRGGGAAMAHFSDTMLAARQRVDKALHECGPEFSGVLLDLCCFLKGLEQIESEHQWPVRSGKVVVNLALSRLARHYGISNPAARNMRIASADFR